VPVLVSNTDPLTSFRSVVDELEEDERPLEGKIEARIAARVCKSAAIRSGQVLSLEEQRTLLRDLEGCETPRTCPHGRPTMIHLSVESLERQFGRRG
jgi:DNA mismatch repair protein MutL